MEQIQGGLHESGNGGNALPGAVAKRSRRNGNDHDPVVGRKDGKDGQEATINVTELKKGMPKAVKVEKDLADARTDASAFYKKFAKSCGLNTAQLRAAAKAYANEEIEGEARKAEQMSLIFKECGEA